MIKTLHQYNVTLTWLHKFRQVLREAKETGRPDDIHPLLYKAQIDGLESMIGTLESELTAFYAQYKKLED